MVSRTAKIAVLLVSLIAAAIFLLPSFVVADNRSIRTSIWVGTEDGEVQHFEEDTSFLGLPQNTIVKVSGTKIIYIRWETSYQATSPDYAEYTVQPTSFAMIELFHVQSPTNFVVCGARMAAPQISPTGNFAVATWYSVGLDFMQHVATQPETIRTVASTIIAKALSGCGLTEGTFFLKYTISISVAAVGTPPVATDTVEEVMSTTITLTAGTITGVTSTTVESGVP